MSIPNLESCRPRLGAFAVLILSSTLALAQAPAAPPAPAALEATPATQSRYATRAPILGVAHAGKRIVAVGDYGVVLLSDDDGKTFRQAQSVPVSSTLTAVSFAGDKDGWAVGHWGAIIATHDGGEHWAIQRVATEVDRPLFSVHFFDARAGVAVGLWSLVLRTEDGGKSWQDVKVPAPPEGGKGDRNLFRLFASEQGTLYVAAERGSVLVSDDRGKSWRYLSTGYAGSLWCGTALRDGTLIVGGLRGTIYRSADGGRSWQAVDSGTKSSLTDLVELGGKVLGVGLDGFHVESVDGGATFKAAQREDRLSLTAAIANAAGAAVLFSDKGIVAGTP